MPEDMEDAIEIEDHDPRWKEMYSEERDLLQRTLGTLALEIHHVGSTAVPDLAAKPIVDILVATRDISLVEVFCQILEPLGFQYVPQDDTGRLFFRKGAPRTHHLHIVRTGTWAYWRHIWFRDYLRDHAITSEEYECLKRVLASRYRLDREAYLRGKGPLIEMILKRAVMERLLLATLCD